MDRQSDGSEEFQVFGANIVIVDDVPQNLTMLRDMLSKHKYRIRPVLSGEMGLKAIRKIPPDLILLDIMMPPGIDGYEVCRRLKADENTCDIPSVKPCPIYSQPSLASARLLRPAWKRWRNLNEPLVKQNHTIWLS